MLKVYHKAQIVHGRILQSNYSNQYKNDNFQKRI